MTNRKNSYKPESKAPEKKSKRSERGVGRTAQSVVDGTFLTRDKVVKQLPFIIYITLLIIVYVGNSYYAEKTLIGMDGLKKELEQLRYEDISTKSRLMQISKQSEVAKRLEGREIKESTVPPHKIVIEK